MRINKLWNFGEEARLANQSSLLPLQKIIVMMAYYL